MNKAGEIFGVVLVIIIFVLICVGVFIEGYKTGFYNGQIDYASKDIRVELQRHEDGTVRWAATKPVSFESKDIDKSKVTN